MIIQKISELFFRNFTRKFSCGYISLNVIFAAAARRSPPGTISGSRAARAPAPPWTARTTGAATPTPSRPTGRSSGGGGTAHKNCCWIVWVFVFLMIFEKNAYLLKLVLRVNILKLKFQTILLLCFTLFNKLKHAFPQAFPPAIDKIEQQMKQISQFTQSKFYKDMEIF